MAYFRLRTNNSLIFSADKIINSKFKDNKDELMLEIGDDRIRTLANDLDQLATLLNLAGFGLNKNV